MRVLPAPKKVPNIHIYVCVDLTHVFILVVNHFA